MISQPICAALEPLRPFTSVADTRFPIAFLFLIPVSLIVAILAVSNRLGRAPWDRVTSAFNGRLTRMLAGGRMEKFPRFDRIYAKLAV